jgi:ubiquinone biosynthesis protein
MVFNLGVVHCDMHPGNLFCRADGGIVLLDFGFVCELSDTDREAFTDFFFGFASGDGRRCARIVVDTALALPHSFDRPAFDEAMEKLIARHHALTAEAFEVAGFAVELFDTQRRFRVTGSTAFTMTIIAFLVLEGAVKTLHPKMDFQAKARRFFVERELGEKMVSAG